MRPRPVCLAALLPAATSAAARAEPSARAGLPGAAQAGWTAVGRRDMAGTGPCTATRVVPGLAVTAAHCVFVAATRSPCRADPLHVLPGRRTGRAAAHLRRAAVAVALDPHLPALRPERDGRH